MPAHYGAARDVEEHVAPPACDGGRRVVQPVSKMGADDLQSGKSDADAVQEDGLHAPSAVPRVGLGFGLVTTMGLHLARELFRLVHALRRKLQVDDHAA